MIIKHINSIRNQIEVLPQSFEYKESNWIKQIDANLLSEIKIFDNKQVSRKIVIQSYKNYFSDESTNEIIPFLLTMIWGFGNTGYGPFRTQKYLNKQNKEFIRNTLEFIKVLDVEKAFRELMEIKGLGISFASKVLYFAGKAIGMKEYPLIFDIRVAKSLIRLYSQTTGIVDMIDVYPKQTWKTYNAYCTMIHGWAKENSVDADQIELFLFKWGNEENVTEQYLSQV